MDQLDMIKNGYIGIHDYMIPKMIKTEEPKLRERIIETINPIIWMAWHILRTEDMYFNTVMFNQPQVFSNDDWMEQLSIKTKHVGTGMTTSEVHEISSSLSVEGLLKYNHSVKDHVLTMLQNPPIDLRQHLDSEEELNRRLQESDSFPEETRQNRAKAYATSDISSGVMGLISHAYMHIGQYFALTKPL